MTRAAAATALPPPDAGPVSGPLPTDVKLACASCIRGHRTSSCTHKDGSKGPLYPIRSKGRPPTQCDYCRQKRKESGRHVRCDCAGRKSPAVPAAAAIVSAATHRSKSLSRKRKASGPVEAASDMPHPQPNPTRRLSATYSNRSDHGRYTPPPMLSSLARLPGLDQTSVEWPPLPLTTGLTRDWSAKTPGSADEPSDLAVEALAPSMGSPRSRTSLSLSNLMNPCRCAASRRCTCCKGSSQGASRSGLNSSSCSPSSNSSGEPLSAASHVVPSCCTTQACCAAKPPQTSSAVQHNHPKSPVRMQNGCCGGDMRRSTPSFSASGGSSPVSTGTVGCRRTSSSPHSPSAPSIELLLWAVDMSTEFVPPKCGCGESCRCPSCLSQEHRRRHPTRSDPSRSLVDGAAASRSSDDASDRSVDEVDCDSCAACDLGLSNPSGIGAVDQWIEQEKKHQRNDAPATATSPLTGPNDRIPNVSSPGVMGKSATDEIRLPLRIDGSTLHGGLLSSCEPNRSASVLDAQGAAEIDATSDEVRAELVLVHPGCSVCLDVVRQKGVGILRSAPSSR